MTYARARAESTAILIGTAFRMQMAQRTVKHGGQSKEAKDVSNELNTSARIITS